ncbi:MAG: insulinase family protein [Acidobacteriota bacterium]|nr:insulinase family protein [Acidobacteriota bacterium]
MKLSWRHLPVACFLPIAFAARIPAQNAPKGVARVTSVEGITEYRLDNGLKVLLFPDPSKNTITVNITFLVGSRNENYGETGMAHLLEHMVFKGTPRHPDVPKELANHGARPNGSTWYDRTNYFEIFSATDENLRWALDLESDRMVNSHIAKKDLDSEMTVVRNEFEAGQNSPFRVLMQRAISAAYEWHNYGKETIGAKSDLEHVPIDRLQAFYRNYYQPDNAVLLVAGKIEEGKTLQLVNETFGKVPRPARQLQATYTLDPVQDGERTVAVRRVGDVQMIDVVYHIPDGGNPDTAAMQVLADMMRRAPTGRLHRALVETKKAASVNAFEFQLREPGVVLFGATVRKESSLDEARDAMLKTIENVAAAPPTSEEVERSKAELLKQVDLELNNSERVGLALSEDMGGGDWRLFFLHRDWIKKVTPDDVLRVAKTYLKQSNRTLALFIPTDKPERSEIPAPTDLVTLLKDYKGGDAVAAGEAFDPSPENIDGRSVRGTLGNGMKLVMVPKKARGNKVNAVIQLHFGDVESLKGTESAPSLAAGMLMRGTAKHTRQQINDELNRLKARITVNGGATGATASIEATRQNLPEAMKLVAEILREPVFPEKEFDELKAQQLAGAETMRTEPQAIAMSALSQHMNPYPKDDPRYVRTPDEQIASLKAVTLDGVRKFYKDFYGASNAELVLVGDFDPEQLQKTSSDLFGSWKSPRPYAKAPYPYRKVDVVNKSFQTPDKANATLGVGMTVKVNDEDADYPALVLGNYILGSGMNSRLFQRVRGKEGLSYGVGSFLSARPKQDGGTFMGFAIFAPQNVNKVETALKEEIARALKEGFTEAEIAEAKKGWLQSQSVSRSQENELANLLGNDAHEDRTVAFQGALEKKVAALTPAQVVEGMRRHMDASQLSVFKAGDFQKAGVTP